MENHLNKAVLMTALITGTVLMGNNAVFAAQELNEFTLDPMVVTATRTEKRDLDVPAIVEVFNEEKIAKSGASNAYDVLQNTLGITSQSQGFNGTGMGTMTSKIMIRGVEKGTLVLVNGVPMNQDGKYDLEDISVEAIEKIEVVKGGGSVLYGSEATGGVINIITKKIMPNRVKVAAGNFGKEQYNVSLGTEKFNIVANLENRGHAKNMSGLAPYTTKTTIYDYGKGERKSVLWNLNLLEGLTFTHNYSKNDHQYWKKDFYTNVRSENNYYKNTDNTFLMQYDKDGWKADVSYGTQEKVYDKASVKNNVVGNITPNSSRKGHNTNLNLQKQFELGNDLFLVGVTYQKEDMDAFSSSVSYPGSKKKFKANSNYRRDNYSIYASYDWQLNEKDNLIVNARQTWTNSAEGTQTNLDKNVTTKIGSENMNKFTPEVQYVHHITNDSSFYAKAGKSFRMPNLTQIFGTGSINPTVDLKPEQGTHYEIGYKSNIGKGTLKTAIFNYEIKDSIDADIKYDKTGSIESVVYINENVKNTGIELSYTMQHDENFTSNLGVVFQNPKAQNIKNYGDNDWHDIYNKYQLQGGVNYKADKFAASLVANFVGDRTSTRAAIPKPQRKLKPQCFTDLHFTYSPEKNQKAFLHINNLFDRIDVTSNSTSNFLSLGRNFMVGYEYSF